MQDYQTGAMVELNPEVVKGIAEADMTFKQRLADLMKHPDFRRKAGEDAGIPVEQQGPVFEIDEIVELKGSRWRVRGFEGGLLHLEGVPRNQ